MPASLPVAGWCIVLRGWWAWMQSETAAPTAATARSGAAATS